MYLSLAPLCLLRSGAILDSIGYGTPALYCVHTIALRISLPISSSGVRQFFRKCCIHVALVVKRNTFISFCCFQCPKFLWASSIFFVLIYMSSTFANVITILPIVFMDGTPLQLKS